VVALFRKKEIAYIKGSMAHKLIFLFLVFCLQNDLFAIDEGRIRKDVHYLASDEMKGRLTGTPEARKAAEYIASEFRKSGLQLPPDYNTPFQSFEFTSGIQLGSSNSLIWNDHAYILKKDFIPIGFSEDGKISSASVVFAGFGIRAPDLNHDSYEGLDVKGKIVVCYRFGPDGKDPKSPFSRFYPIRYKSIVARDLGAAALLIIAENTRDDELLQLRRDSTFGTAGIPVISVKQSVIAEWLKSSGNQLPNSEDPHTDLSFELNHIQVSLSSDLVREKSKSENVLGWLPASNSTKETLIIGAHYDHLGLGAEGSLSPKWGEVHNGADDNASGVSGLLEMARFFGSRKEQLKRNVLFIAFGGEELGVLGSAHFVKHPAVPLEKVVAMLNMDMIGRLRDKKLVVGGTGTSPAWKRMLTDLNTGDLKIAFQEDGYGPSDHSVFYSKDIPVLFFFTGSHAEYHRPEDDANKIEYSGMVEVLQYVSRIGQRIVEMPSRPQFVRVKAKAPSVASGGFHVYLGTIPDYGEEVKGVKLTGVREGSPAEKAGIKGGDIIVEFGSKTIQNIYDYTYALQQFKADDTVTVIVLREDKRIPLKVTLEGRNTE
jgi:hypothetical protein